MFSIYVVSQPQPTTQPSVNIAVSSQQTTQQVQPPAYQYIQQQPQVVQPGEYFKSIGRSERA